MRSAHRVQPSLPIGRIPHKHALQLHRIAQILDGLPQLEAQVLDDLTPRSVRRDVGREGLSAQQVLRTFVLYLILKVDFEQLEFHLADSPTYRTFCLLGVGDSAPKHSCLQENISRIRPETLQALHRIVVEHAVAIGVESGHTVRTDTTPVAAPMRAPLDSALLGDAVRVLIRLLRRAQTLVPMSIPSHHRRVRRRTAALRAEKLDEEERAALFFDLLQDTKRYVEAALLAADFLDGVDDPKAFLLAANLRAQAESALCIIDQTERRVLDGQTLPSTAKRLSMFETHVDTLRKRDQVVFGHKVCLSFGKTGVVLAADILRGNPADATLAVAAIAQVEGNTGRTPHDAAMDLGFASHDNVAALKDLGVQRVAFPNGRRIDGQKACGSRRVQRKLYRFRAGVEGLISWLKRSLAMGRSRWKGEQGFCAYVWGVLVTGSLQALAAAS
jgi:IS5 family transposase